MKIDSLTVGPIGTNCYILQEEQAKLCAAPAGVSIRTPC